MSSKVTEFPRHNLLKGKSKKPPESGGFCQISPAGRAPRLEPFGATLIPAGSAIPIVTVPIVAASPVAVVAVQAAHEPTVTPTAVKPALHMRQDREATFLAVVQGLVERTSRIRDALHRRRRGGHGVGAIAQACYRLGRILGILLRILLLRILGIATLRIHP